MWTVLYISLSNLQTYMQKHTHSEVTFYLKSHSLLSQWLWGSDISLVPAVQWQLRHPKEGEGRMMVPLFTCYERKWESFFSQSSMWCLQCCFLSNDVFIPSELGWWIKQKMAIEIVIIVIGKPPLSVASGSQTWSIFSENEVDIRVRYCAYLKTETENCTPPPKKSWKVIGGGWNACSICWVLLHLHRMTTVKGNEFWLF